VRRAPRPTLFAYTTLFRSAEQRLVEELRRRRRVQQAQALGGELAQAFQLAGAQGARAVLDQGGDGDEVALEGLLQAVRDRPQAEDRKSTRLNSSHVKISYA